MDILTTFIEFLQTWPVDHPIFALIISYAGVRALPIIYFLLFVLKTLRDNMIDDTEAAELMWRLVSLTCGFLPTKSKKAILNYAPCHWHEVILEGKPIDFKLTVVPLKKGE